VSYDPAGSGAAPEEVLVRRGTGPESARRLNSLATRARGAGFGHGVSVTSVAANQNLARDPHDYSSATRRAFEEAGFSVIYTPTRADTDHHTVILPEPVTDEVAARFNAVLRRMSQGQNS
jgi:hypothetical protein